MIITLYHVLIVTSATTLPALQPLINYRLILSESLHSSDDPSQKYSYFLEVSCYIETPPLDTEYLPIPASEL